MAAEAILVTRRSRIRARVCRCGPTATMDQTTVLPMLGPWGWTVAATCLWRGSHIHLAAAVVLLLTRRLRIRARACRCGPTATMDRETVRTGLTPWRLTLAATCL